ncbi:MAG: pacearchaeosortase [archaeon]
MDRQFNKITEIFSRYILILLVGFGNLYIFYKVLTPLTVHTLNFIISLFTATLLIENTIYIKWLTIEIVPACIAGSAFYLLFILIFSTPRIKLRKRIYMFTAATISLFLLNVTRILFLIAITNISSFDLIHWIFWNLVSVVFVVALWVILVKIYKIKEIPIYSDVRYFYNLIKTKQKSPRKKKH